MNDNNGPHPGPFLKWAGGKRLLLKSILSCLPKLGDDGTYYEPFLGGGAVFFAVQPVSSVLSDVNEELVEVYGTLRDLVEEVAAVLESLPYTESDYYRIRDWKPDDPISRSARFIYLNKTCFNGLYRVNSRGEFNVPFGRHGASPLICNRQQLQAASNALQRARIFVADFEESVTDARQGDLVYFDPPYTTAHSNNGFVAYNAKVFSWDDQRRLAGVCFELIDRGVSVVVSNADHESIRDCYQATGQLVPKRIERWSTIAGKAPKRFRTTELLMVDVHSAGAIS